MAKHFVKFTLPEKTLERADMNVEVRTKNGRTEKLMGILKLSRGGLVWQPSRQSGRHRLVLSWEGFSLLAEGLYRKRHQNSQGT
jgi:hypothetical protein